MTESNQDVQDQILALKTLYVDSIVYIADHPIILSRYLLVSAK